LTSSQSSPGRRFVTLPMLSLPIALGLLGCTAQAEEPLELEDTVEIAPLDDTSLVPASEAGPAQHVAEPVLPDVARENSPEGAKATITYFWEAVDYVRMTGDAQPAASASHYLCDICTEFIFRWQQLYDAGAWAGLHGATEIEIVETQSYVEEDDQEAWTAVLFHVTEPASDFYADGELIEEESIASTTLEGWWAELTYDEAEQRWKIEWLDQDDSLASSRDD